MKRRVFFKYCGLLGCTGLVSSLFPACSKRGETIKFGVVTDLHFAHRKQNGDRYYEDSLNKLNQALNEFSKQSLDFIIELGDLKDQSLQPNAKETLSYLDEIETCLQTYSGDVYHVLGNHDMDSLSKEDFLSHIHNPGSTNGLSYYSFKRKGLKFIVLDANFNADLGDYKLGNFDWKVALIPPKELSWLENELKKGTEPVVVFIHQLLDSDSGLYKGLYVQNAKEVNRLLIESKRVLAVIQGHHHGGFYSKSNGIHYLTVPGMITGPFPEKNSFAIVEINQQGDLLVDGFYRCPDRILRNENIPF